MWKHSANNESPGTGMRHEEKIEWKYLPSLMVSQSKIKQGRRQKRPFVLYVDEV